MGGGEELELDPWFFGVGLGVYYYLLGGDVEVEGLVFAEEVGF